MAYDFMLIYISLQVDVPEDQHIYSNVEFASGLMVKEVDEDTEKESETSMEEKDEKETSSTGSKSSLLGEGNNKILETNLDALDSSASESQMVKKTFVFHINIYHLVIWICLHNAIW